jgi:hypothetical protein
MHEYPWKPIEPYLTLRARSILRISNHCTRAGGQAPNHYNGLVGPAYAKRTGVDVCAKCLSRNVLAQSLTKRTLTAPNLGK